MKTIEAQRIVLTDESGATRVLIDAGAGDDSASLTLFGRGHASLALQVYGDGKAFVSFYRSDGTEAIGFGSTPEFGAGIVLNDDEGKQRFFIESPVGGKEGSIHILNAQGQVIWHTDT
ncbi:MAG: hypothetical protein KDA42_16505 [Planctomycetales bacterium]|nr:hypothetical protein [Planctomycetales bacterium]